MGRIVQTVVSIVVLAALLGICGFGWWWYRKEGDKDRTIEEQRRVIDALGQKLDHSWADELVADVRVNAVGKDPNSGEPNMKLTFAQYAPGTEKPSLTKTMTLVGEEFFVDALVVRFDRKLVEEGDGLKGKSLLMFRRMFGDRQKPVDGVPLYRSADDVALVIPEQLQVDRQPTPFETQIWTKFWTFANDPKTAAEAGVRVAQGEAVHVRPVTGQVYKITLRSSAGLELQPRLPAAMVGEHADAAQ